MVFLTLLGSASAWELYAQLVTLVQAPHQESISPSSSAPGERPLRIDRAPLRTLHEDHSYAAFYAVAVDPVRDEILLQSANRPSVRVYDRRLESTSPRPKRWIEGPEAKIGSTGLFRA